MKFMDSFAEKHPKAAEWVRKGGLFLIFSWVVTALKAVMLMVHALAVTHFSQSKTGLKYES